MLTIMVEAGLAMLVFLPVKDTLLTLFLACNMCYHEAATLAMYRPVCYQRSYFNVLRINSGCCTTRMPA